MSDKLRMRKLVLMFIEGIVHLPKLSLRTRCFRCFSRCLGMSMNRCERKIPKNKAHVAAQGALKLLDHGMGFATIRAFVVAILEQRYWRVGRSLNAIVRPDIQPADSIICPSSRHAAAPFSSKSSRASRIPSAPGLMPIGET